MTRRPPQPAPDAQIAAPYDPWAHLAALWPEIEVVVEPMTGSLLGQLRYPVIALRAGTSAAQRRCTLAHEIVHLERGVGECGRWAEREEQVVHEVAARRLIRCPELVTAVRQLGAEHDPGRLADALGVDRQTLRVRFEVLTRAERARVRAAARGPHWRVA